MNETIDITMKEVSALCHWYKYLLIDSLLLFVRVWFLVRSYCNSTFASLWNLFITVLLNIKKKKLSCKRNKNNVLCKRKHDRILCHCRLAVFVFTSRNKIRISKITETARLCVGVPLVTVTMDTGYNNLSWNADCGCWFHINEWRVTNTI